MSRPEERRDRMVDVVTQGGGISKGGPARGFWLEHWPWGGRGELEDPVRIYGKASRR